MNTERADEYGEITEEWRIRLSESLEDEILTEGVSIDSLNQLCTTIGRIHADERLPEALQKADEDSEVRQPLFLQIEGEYWISRYGAAEIMDVNPERASKHLNCLNRGYKPEKEFSEDWSLPLNFVRRKMVTIDSKNYAFFSLNPKSLNETVKRLTQENLFELTNEQESILSDFLDLSLPHQAMRAYERIEGKFYLSILHTFYSFLKYRALWKMLTGTREREFSEVEPLLEKYYAEMDEDPVF